MLLFSGSKGNFFMTKTFLSKRLFTLFLIMATVFTLVAPIAAFANMRSVYDQMELMRNQRKPFGQLPKTDLAEPRRSFEVTVTAYSSDPWQTDDSPFITASGTHVHDGVIAANFLPIGTRVRFPELYGGKIFIVEDRMNERYYYHADIWMSETSQAIEFGAEYTTIEIF